MYRAILFSIALLAATSAWADITGPARVIDGDTLDIAGERIRLHGIDAPESRQTCIADGATWPCGQSATDALTEFIGGGAAALGAPIKARVRALQPQALNIRSSAKRSPGAMSGSRASTS